MRDECGRVVRCFPLLLVIAACAHHRFVASSCSAFERVAAPEAALPLDLGAAKPYRNYMAVTAVGPFAHHFEVRYQGIEPALVYVQVHVDEQGRVTIESEGWFWGGVAVADRRPIPPPAEVAPLARAIEREFQAKCQGDRQLALSYLGAYRSVTVAQFIAHDLAAGPIRGGWTGQRVLHADAALTRVVNEGDSSSGWGRIEIPGSARWVELGDAESGSRSLVPIAGAVAARVLAVARAADAGQPVTALAAVRVVAPAALLPPGYRARVVLAVALHGRGEHDVIARDAELPLDVHDAVFSRASADAEATIGSVHYKLHATLAPEAPHRPSSTREEAPYRGTLHLRVEDDLGHAFERDYVASGQIDAEGDAVVAPAGFDLPGASSPSREHDLLHHTFAPVAELRGVDVDVAVSMFDDPRRAP
jgi:hypothetical protein